MRADELPTSGLLAELDDEARGRLAARMTRERVREGEAVVREGEPGDRFYVVLDGTLAIEQEGRGARGVVEPGDYFGEVAVALGMNRTATVRALTAATVASCDRTTFEEFVRPLFAEDAEE